MKDRLQIELKPVFCLTLLLLSLPFLACGGEPPQEAAAPASANRPASIADFEGGASPSTDLPSGHPPINDQGMPAIPPGAGSGTTGITWSIPEGWQEEPPSSSMRKAQYRIEGAAGDAELVVFYFGPGQGGDAQSNAERWASQFAQADGSDPVAAMKTDTQVVNGLNVMLVETTGTYKNSMAPMAGGSQPQGDYMLLAAIVQGPDANWFFKLVGPSQTVEAQRGAFQEFTASVNAGS